jgi:polysaccharide export outer membrane protein
LVLSLVQAGLAPAQSLDYVVGPHDVLSIYIFGHPEFSSDAVVSADGHVFLALVGAVQVGGMTTREIRAVLTEAYGAHIVDPKVTVGLSAETRKRVSVLGRVVRPGAFPYIEGGSLSSYLAQAGGFASGADIRRARVVRLGPEGPLVYSIDLAKIFEQGRRDLDIELMAGDALIVPETLLSRTRGWLPVIGLGVGILTTYLVWEGRR